MRTRLFHRFLPIAILLVAAALAGAAKAIFWKHKPEARRGSSYYQAPSQLHPDYSEREITGAVSGKVVDENDSPVYAIDVTMFPVGSPAESGNQSNNVLDERTNKDGTYQFPMLKPGEYLLGVGVRDAPTGERPFFTSYYPGVDRKTLSEPIRVQGNMKIELRTIRLRRMQTATVKIHVKWQDGSPVERSNLLFYNASLRQVMNGNGAPQITNGEGQFVVPLGFEYYARVGVWCDGGTQIDMRESRPVQELRIDSKHIPQELTFVMHSDPCKLWSPP